MNYFILQEVRVNGVHAGYRARVFTSYRLESFVTDVNTMDLTIRFVKCFGCILRGIEILVIGSWPFPDVVLCDN